MAVAEEESSIKAIFCCITIIHSASLTQENIVHAGNNRTEHAGHTQKTSNNRLAVSVLGNEDRKKKKMNEKS